MILCPSLENSTIHISMGANAITGLRMETNTIFEGTVDMVLYGTAVHVNR